MVDKDDLIETPGTQVQETPAAAEAPRPARRPNPPGVGGPERPARLVGIYSKRPLKLEEMPRLLEFCSRAYGEETPGASLTLQGTVEGAGPNVFRVTAVPGALLKESDIFVRVHAADDPASDAPALVNHLARLDAEIGGMARDATADAASYVAVIGTRLSEQNRVRAYLNTAALIGSALGAVFIDPTAVMVTPDPGEWAEACEQSLSIECAVANLQQS